MSWTVAYSRRADRDLANIPPAEAATLRADFRKLAADPTTRDVDVKKLEPKERGLWRLRHGNYRAIFKRDRDTRTLQVLTVDDRKEMYR
ncbi:MAG: type II toxin-antitoxin system RelE family toxin [Candidatus Dormibacteria bacterium]